MRRGDMGWTGLLAALLLAACASTPPPPPAEDVLLLPADQAGLACAHQCDVVRARCTGQPPPPAPQVSANGAPVRRLADTRCGTPYSSCVVACGGRMVDP